MKNGCLLFILIILSFKAASQNKYDAILKKDYPRKLKLLDSIGARILGSEEDSATALRHIDTLQHEISKTGDAKAKAYIKYLRYAFALMKQHTDSLSSEKMKAEIISLADHEDFPALKAFAYLRQGIYYEEMQGEEVNAFENYLKAYDIYSRLTSEDFPTKLYSLYSLANSYYKAYAFDEAIRYSQMVISDKTDDDQTKMYTWCLMGLSYNQRQKLDSSLFCCLQTLKLAEKAGNKFWEANSLLNAGAVSISQKKFKESLDYIERSLSIYNEIYPEVNNDPFVLVILATDYLELNRIDSVTPLIPKIKAGIKDNPQPANFYFDYYKMLVRYYKETGNAAEAYSALDSVISNNDRYIQNQLYQKKPKIEVKIAEEKRAYAEELAGKQKTVNNWIIISGLLLLGFMFMLYNRFRLTTRMKQKQLLAENKLAKEQLENNNKLLLGYLQNITEKNELIEKIMAELETLKSKEGDDKKQTDEIIEKLRNTVILTEDHWKEFQGLYGKVYQDFSDRLLTKAPDLTSAEMRYIMLDNLGLSSKDMARTLGVGHEAIRQTRFRLKKKLSLQENETLEDWMKTFKEEIMPSQN